MSMTSKRALHAFLFHLRTPLSSISGLAKLIESAEIPSDKLPSEAHAWLTKWLPNVETWLKSTYDLTEFYGKSKDEDHDWKALIQQLIITLEGVEIAAKEANEIPHSEKNEPGDLLPMIINSMQHIDDSCKEIQELLPTLRS